MMSRAQPAMRLQHLALAAAALGWAFLPSPALPLQLAICVPAIAIFGLPHGATDWALARAAFGGDHPRTWPLVFACLYAGLAGLVALAAWAAPMPALIGFVLLSVWHFGAEDAAAAGLRPGLAECVACGALPVAAPLAFWPGQTSHILQLMGVAAIPAALQTIGLACLAAWLAAALIAWARHGRLRYRFARNRLARECGLLLLLGLAAPPLAAFTLYFCALHAPRHMRALPPGLAGWEMLPVSLVAIAAIGATLWLAGGGTTLRLDWAGANGIFWGLACLALPHVALGRLAAAPAPALRPLAGHYQRTTP